MIKLENVTRTYGRKVAVNDLSLDVPAGELFAFLGPNGAGKTTTIRMMVGLLRPSLGKARIGGFDVASRPRDVAAALGYVPEEPYLYDKLTGREFLEFVGRVRGFDRKETRRRIGVQTEQFRLRTFLDSLTETYSHGMKQRMAFAAALLHDPAVLVVDEPTVGLDPASVRLLKDHFRRRVADGMTIFMSTHTLTVAEEIADRIGIVDHGRLIYVGTRDEIRRQSESGESSLEPFFLRLTGEGDALGNGQSCPAASGEE